MNDLATLDMHAPQESLVFWSGTYPNADSDADAERLLAECLALGRMAELMNYSAISVNARGEDFSWQASAGRCAMQLLPMSGLWRSLQKRCSVPSCTLLRPIPLQWPTVKSSLWRCGRRRR